MSGKDIFSVTRKDWAPPCVWFYWAVVTVYDRNCIKNANEDNTMTWKGSFLSPDINYGDQ